MKALFAAAGLALVLVSSARSEDKDHAKTIVGHWEVIKSPDAKSGSHVEFTRDGKLILTQKGKNDQKLEATYKIEGDKLTTVRRNKGEDEVNVLIIKTLNDTTLVTENDKGTTDELKRVKGSKSR